MIKSNLKKLLSCSKGATALEYGLIAALIVAASMGALTTMSSTFILNFNDSASKITSAMD